MAAIQREIAGGPQRLRALVPLESLSDESFNRVAASLSLQRVQSGTMLFRLGKRNDYTLYLLEGVVELSAFGESEHIEAGSERARRPLVDIKPHQFTGTAVTDCVVAVIESALLEKHLTWDQMARRPVEGYEVREFEGTADVNWMLQMLQTQVFMRLPTGNIQTLFSRFQEVPVTRGSIVIKQGDPGDYYYIIKEGRCSVTRRAGEDETDVKLAELGPRDAFGEEALLSDSPRNATVTMLTDGRLMRLARGDFSKLMTEPLVNYVDGHRMAAMVRQGAVMLDVRLESEFEQGSVAGAHNLPLYLLRLKASALDPEKHYIVLCDTGARSAAAAFLLSERGLNVSVVAGGLAALAHRQSRKPPSIVM